MPKRAIRKFIFPFLERPKVRIILRIVQAPLAALIILPLGLFDKTWYGVQYSGTNREWIRRKMPLAHYLVIGRMKGLSPNPFFVGEYFDKDRWDKSIIDPLIKYILIKRYWSRPTSILFDGSRVGSGTTKLPPLVSYTRQMRNHPDTVLSIPKDINIMRKVRWSDIKDQIYELATIRTNQYLTRRAAEPVNKFDFRTEKKIIEKYIEYDFGGNPPTVSIVMPVWNRKDVVVDAINSVIAQTYSNWELLIVDDGSTDGSVEVTQAFADKDKRIKLIKSPHQGVCRARNMGIEKASGEWIAFLDSDNTWTKYFLQSAIGMVHEHGYKAAYAAVKMDNRGKVRYRVSEPNPELLKTGNYIDLNTLVVDRTILDEIGNFDENLRRMVDYDLVCKISKKVKFLYVPVIGVNYVDHDDLARISTTESMSWDGVVKNNNHIEWHEATKGRKTDRISIIVPVRGTVQNALNCLNKIVETTDPKSVEIIVVDASSGSAINTTIGIFARINGLRYYREPATRDTVLASNYGFAHSTGEIVTFVNQHVTVEHGWLTKLTAGIKNNQIVGPLQLQPNRNIRSAGVEYVGENQLPVNILENHPISDIETLPLEYNVNSLMSGAFAVKATLFARLKGLNPLYDRAFEMYDFCNRARKYHKSTVIIRKEATVINPDGGRGWYSAPQEQYMKDWSKIFNSETSDIWKSAGFKVIRYDLNFPEKGNMSSLRPVLNSVRSKGEYRWAIKISAPADERRFKWGDYYYALALAKSLKKLGQSVAIDFHENHMRPTSYLDDILLDLRGLDDTMPQSNTLNIMWVISHPNLIELERLKSYDVVFAAGNKWASTMSLKIGKEIKYLPQATDFSIKNTNSSDKRFVDKIIFVGNSRNVMRPIVADAIDAGLDISVYGGGWEKMLDKRYIKANLLPNNEIPSAYASARMVLNDHWQDMKEWGFLSNRLFDAAAVGARIVSDDIDGVKDIFEKHVYVYRSIKDLERLNGKIDNLFPSKSDREKFATHIINNHSFDSRAKTLLDEATRAIRLRTPR